MNLPEGVRPHLRGLRHVGIVTDDREALIARMKTVFGVADADILRVPADDAEAETRFAFLPLGGVPLEVIEPVSPQYRALLLATPRGTNHLCFNVDDLPAAIAAMARAGVRLGHVTPGGMIEMPHARMAYFNPADTGGVLIELVEPKVLP